MMNKIKLILAVLVTTFCLSFFSVVFAQQKEGFFIGWSQPLSGSGDLEIESTNSEYQIPDGPGGSTTIPAITVTDKPDVDFEGGYGIKAGYNFSQFRIYYSFYNITYKDSADLKNTAINSNLIFGDWVYKGFFVGLGYGKANFETKSKHTNISIAGTGDVNVFNLGYDYKINENFKISGGYFIAKFGFKFDENYTTEITDQNGNIVDTIEVSTNSKIKARGDAFYIDAVYTF